MQAQSRSPFSRDYSEQELNQALQNINTVQNWLQRKRYPISPQFDEIKQKIQYEKRQRRQRTQRNRIQQHQQRMEVEMEVEGQAPDMEMDMEEEITYSSQEPPTLQTTIHPQIPDITLYYDKSSQQVFEENGNRKYKKGSKKGHGEYEGTNNQTQQIFFYGVTQRNQPQPGRFKIRYIKYGSSSTSNANARPTNRCRN